MNKLKVIAAIFTLFIGICVKAQTPSADLHTKNKKSIEAYHQAELLQKERRWSEAINLLNTIIQKDTGFVEAYLKAGGLYMAMGDKTSARRYFSKASDMYPSVKSFAGMYFTAAGLNYEEGKYEKAKRYFQQSLAVLPTDKRIVDQAPLYITKCDYAIELMKHPVDFKPVLMGPPLNTFFSQSHPVLTADRQTLYFTKLTGLSRQDQEDILVSTYKDNAWTEPVSISSNINSPVANEGTCSISMDGNSLVFVACGKADGLGSCDIYISNKVNGVWSKPTNVGSAINSTDWDSHPCLSADGRTLYFTSARKGGYGKEDIYISHMNDQGDWLPAVNAGPKINTSGTDYSPFIHADGRTLYFSSDGWMGLGGLDIFYSSGSDTSWSVPKNLGYPLNTYLNDETLFITVDGKKGYYSRFKGEVNYTTGIVMYEFDMPDAFKPEKLSTFAQGHIYDKQTKKPLGARVELIDIASGKVTQSVMSDSITGQYTVVITEGKEYAVYVNKKQYLFESLNFDYRVAKDFNPLTLDVYLTPIKTGSHVTLNNIFFPTNSYKLEDKSLVELNKLIAFINLNPNQRIELSGYTDNVGSAESNMTLSTMRAKAVYDYLISKGIKSTFITYKGYGASSPVADNTTEEGRQKNRRLEIKIL
ncbi:OmpA family protein [Cytophaga aurantiaca]|uniref:OmpA family protein n=1 Tax=Cytophaga aurantiaca TaxID=29530 RepID=UPI00035EBC0F|nr:OmpA family protein [Cytophaga aurantiaca]